MWIIESFVCRHLQFKLVSSYPLSHVFGWSSEKFFSNVYFAAYAKILPIQRWVPILSEDFSSRNQINEELFAMEKEQMSFKGPTSCFSEAWRVIIIYVIASQIEHKTYTHFINDACDLEKDNLKIGLSLFFSNIDCLVAKLSV